MSNTKKIATPNGHGQYEYFDMTSKLSYILEQLYLTHVFENIHFLREIALEIEILSEKSYINITSIYNNKRITRIHAVHNEKGLNYLDPMY